MIINYAVYVAISLIITVWVGRTLNKNGRTFLIENFKGNVALADSVNHLLLVGFYLVNIGFVSLALRYGKRPITAINSIEYLSTKIGFVVVVIGIMHFVNMRMLIKFRSSALFKALAPEPEEQFASKTEAQANPALPQMTSNILS